ncbi:MAG: hypothetical protein HKN19_19560 [Halioglobus sp.]|nr:hypothetical protein [Halioglobus sp.]
MRRLAWLLVGMVIGAGLCAAVLLPWSRTVDADLDSAWASFIDGLNRAQAGLTDPKQFPPELTERNLAEGHRYLLGHLGRMIEFQMRADPRFPEFFRSMDMLRKWTGENPDAIYLLAPIDAGSHYEVTGRAADTRGWRDSGRYTHAPEAPRMVTFATITNVPGATGNLLEMGTCRNMTLSHIGSFDIEPDEAGVFTLRIGPERPAGYAGYFLDAKKVLNCPATGESAERSARYLSVREVFSNWDNEEALDLSIRRLDTAGHNRPPIDSEYMATRLRRLGEELPNQVFFWQQVLEIGLEVNRDVNMDGRRAMPVNGINDPAPPFTAAGVAGAGQLYAGGLFDIAQGEALVIKVSTPVEPHYLGLQLNNGWFEGPDQQNYTSSLTGYQLPQASDGARYFIIAHTDPGLQGWVDTTGIERGAHAMRFVFREEPAAQDLPRLETTVIALDDLAGYLPRDTPRVSAAQRRAEIAARQAHIKRRWRAY